MDPTLANLSSLGKFGKMVSKLIILGQSRGKFLDILGYNLDFLEHLGQFRILVILQWKFRRRFWPTLSLRPRPICKLFNNVGTIFEFGHFFDILANFDPLSYHFAGHGDVWPDAGMHTEEVEQFHVPKHRVGGQDGPAQCVHRGRIKPKGEADEVGQHGHRGQHVPVAGVEHAQLLHQRGGLQHEQLKVTAKTINSGVCRPKFLTAEFTKILMKIPKILGA